MFNISQNMIYLTRLTEWIFSFKSKQDKNIIIDPISCLIKLSILSLYPQGTKVSVSNNGINFSNSTIFQGTIRFIQGDRREDLHNLFKPIQKSIEWYWNNEKYETKLEELFTMSEKGLENLKGCYEPNSTIQHSLDHYILYLKNKNHFNQENQKSITNSSNIIYQYLQSLWSLREINIVIELFQEYKTKTNQEEKENIITNINNMTNTKEKMLNDFIKEQSTTL